MSNSRFSESKKFDHYSGIDDSLLTTDDFRDLFNSFGINYNIRSPWIEIGDCNAVDNWILIISVFSEQVESLLRKILPILCVFDTPFRVLQNRKLINQSNGLWFGETEAGKIINICTRNKQEAIFLAKRLVPVTEEYKGITIHDSIRIGKNIYAAYCKRAQEIRGRDNDRISKMEIIYDIPPRRKIPFSISSKYKEKKRKKIIGKYYVPLFELVKNPKGDIIKGVNIKNWALKTCIIKQARSESMADSLGRGAIQRLIWQKQVILDIQDQIPTAKFIDFCEKNSNYYLIIEYIDSINLETKISNLLNGKKWEELDSDIQTQLLQYFSEVLKIVKKLHKIGYIHRDLNVKNILIDKNDAFYIIDFELSFSIKKRIPNPAYLLGTLGFVAPEQDTNSQPEIYQDIYSLGAILAYMIIVPTHISQLEEDLSENLDKKCVHKELQSIIRDCMQENPTSRPNIDEIEYRIKDLINLKSYVNI